MNRGYHNMYVPFLGTQAWIRSHNNSLTDHWRPWMIGGGHTPEYKPEESYIMFQSGDHIMYVPFLGNQAWIGSLNYSLTDYWRPWMIRRTSSLDSLCFGRYTRTSTSKLTFATIKRKEHDTLVQSINQRRVIMLCYKGASSAVPIYFVA
ncbi:hypothetical protein HID58_053568 [Brassica napus]|uniref:Uncharacterized protein n=1 Tax=Brassica napus TaxID=3708 RepID=A0ABQ8AF29_BRANA|nr:hypothetical protein HID58_053568 [Brassica napus]